MHVEIAGKDEEIIDQKAKSNRLVAFDGNEN